jgi:hypothetical protein
MSLRNWPRIGVLAILGCFVGLALAVGACLAWELIDPALLWSGDLPSGASRNYRVLAMVTAVGTSGVLGSLLGWGIGGLTEPRS